MSIQTHAPILSRPPQDYHKRWGRSLLLVLLVLGMLQWLFSPQKFFSELPGAQAQNPQISLGEDLLFQSPTAAKKVAVQAFRQGDYLTAIEKFQTSLLQEPDDPEAYIYLNNARSRLKGDAHPLRIAVSVPIGNNPAIAAEMLRGVAQAQDQSRDLGINGIPLEIVIANDNNDANTAATIAQTIAQDPQILAVIGSNASGPSLAAAAVYQDAGVVMIAPTGFSGKLSGFGSYIFRTIPNIKTLAESLAYYSVQSANQKIFLICVDSKAPDNVAFQAEFVQAATALQAQILPISCDLSEPQLPGEDKVNVALTKGADAMLIAPHVDYPDRAIRLAQAAQGQLALLGSPTMYNSTILKQGNDSIKDLVVTAPWYANPDSTTSFLARAAQRWGDTSLTWRTATSFDATQAIATALRQIPPEQPLTRSTLQQQLRRPDFVARGAGEDVRFLPTGDRTGEAILLKVQRNAKQEYGFTRLSESP